VSLFICLNKVDARDCFNTFNLTVANAHVQLEISLDDCWAERCREEARAAHFHSITNALDELCQCDPSWC